MPVAKQFSLMVENKRGALAEVCTKLAEKAVNILGLMAPEQPGVVPVRLVVNSLDTAKKVFEGMGVKFSEEDVLIVRLSDRPGALGKVTRKLADHGFDIKYAYGSILKGAGQATIYLGVSDVQKAAEIA